MFLAHAQHQLGFGVSHVVAFVEPTWIENRILKIILDIQTPDSNFKSQLDMQ